MENSPQNEAAKPGALSAVRRVRGWLSRRHLILLEGIAAICAVAAVLSLALAGGERRLATAEASPGDPWGMEARLIRVSAEFSPFANELADRLIRGASWTPPGAEGWGIYDLTPPNLFTRRLEAEDARAMNALLKPADFPIVPMSPFILDAATPDYLYALDCLTQAVYYEAGFESGEGQRAVAQVVLNRVRHPAYPNSVCSVVYQGSQRTTGCQFSFTCDGSLGRPPAEAAWARSRDVARAALAGSVYAGIGSATHYHADYVFPYWAVTLVKLDQIGAHIFYRISGPRGQPVGFTSAYAGGEANISASVLAGGDTMTPDAPPDMEAVKAIENAQPRTVTLTTGGEARTYFIGEPGTLSPAVGGQERLPEVAALDLGVPQRPDSPVAGTITPARRMPSPEEAQEINNRLLQMQMEQAPRPLTPGAPPAR